MKLKIDMLFVKIVLHREPMKKVGVQKHTKLKLNRVDSVFDPRLVILVSPPCW